MNFDITKLKDNVSKHFDKLIFNNLQIGIDYDPIVNTSRFILKKNGAKKITKMFDIKYEFEIKSKSKHKLKTIYNCMMICRLYKNNEILHENMAVANSQETIFLSIKSENLEKNVMEKAKDRAFIDSVISYLCLNYFVEDIYDVEIML